MNNVDKLYEMLRKVQEPKGYFFNKDRKQVLELLEALLDKPEPLQQLLRLLLPRSCVWP